MRTADAAKFVEADEATAARSECTPAPTFAPSVQLVEARPELSEIDWEALTDPPPETTCQVTGTPANGLPTVSRTTTVGWSARAWVTSPSLSIAAQLGEECSGRGGRGERDLLASRSRKRGSRLLCARCDARSQRPLRRGQPLGIGDDGCRVQFPAAARNGKQQRVIPLIGLPDPSVTFAVSGIGSQPPATPT